MKEKEREKGSVASSRSFCWFSDRAVELCRKLPIGTATVWLVPHLAEGVKVAGPPPSRLQTMLRYQIWVQEQALEIDSDMSS